MPKNSARPFDIAWARNTIAQCKAAGVACFVKQLGAKPGDSSSPEYLALPAHQRDGLDVWLYGSLHLKDRKGGDMAKWPEDLRVREMPEGRS